MKFMIILKDGRWIPLALVWLPSSWGSGANGLGHGTAERETTVTTNDCGGVGQNEERGKSRWVSGTRGETSLRCKHPGRTAPHAVPEIGHHGGGDQRFVEIRIGCGN